MSDSLVLDLESWPRRPHFEFFRRYEMPFWNVTAEVDERVSQAGVAVQLDAAVGGVPFPDCAQIEALPASVEHRAPHRTQPHTMRIHQRRSAIELGGAR